MKSESTTIDCPKCGDENEITFTEEYQGQRPHGDYVNRVERTAGCACEWDDDTWESARETAQDNLIERHNDGPEYDPVEHGRRRY